MGDASERGYWCVRFYLRPEHADALLGILERSSPLGVEEREGELLAYYSSTSSVEDILRPVAEDLRHLGARWQSQWIRAENWNARWAESIQPVAVDDAWLIVPVGHATEDLPGMGKRIYIYPAMAFGTGHHETTRMMLRALSCLELSGKEVLDAGTGSGILAIAAMMEGARSVTAVDRQKEAIDNAQHNARLNGIDGIHFVQADILCWKPLRPFDIVLANIHRQVVHDFIQKIDTYLRSGGTLVCSGYFATERYVIERAAQAVGMSCIHVEREGEWCCDTFVRSIKE